MIGAASAGIVVALAAWWQHRRASRRGRLSEGPQVQLGVEGRADPLRLIYSTSADRKRRRWTGR